MIENVPAFLKVNRRGRAKSLDYPLHIPHLWPHCCFYSFASQRDKMMEKLKRERARSSEDEQKDCGSPGCDTAGEEGETHGKQEGTTTTTTRTTSESAESARRGAHRLLLNGVAKETAHGGCEPKQEVAVIELATRGDIKGTELEANGRHTVQTTELRRPPVPLPLPPREPLNEAKRMVQLSPAAFPALPARAMLYSNMAQPLATLNR